MNLHMSEDAHEELLLQERLRVLLRRLKWSYANLWTLNPETRALEWTRGHFEVVNARAGAREYAQLFYTTSKPCCIAPGVGAVGKTNFEGKPIWLSGEDVCRHAGSLEQSQFLKCAQIQTILCIPWLESVLEIGTINVVAENVVLTDRIQQVLANDLLSVVQSAAVGEEYEEYASSTGAKRGAAMFAGFSEDAVAGHGSLPDQTWRLTSSLSLSLSSDVSQMQPNDETLAFGHAHATSAASASAPARSEIVTSQSPGLMTDQYRALWSSAGVSSTSADMSRQEDSSARAFSASPDLQRQFHAHSSPLSNPQLSADDRPSTSGIHPSHIRRANSCGDQYDIQKYHTLDEAQEMHQQWRQQLHPASDLAANSDVRDPFSLPAGHNFSFRGSWPQDVSFNEPSRRSSAMRGNVKIMNEVSKIAGPLLRGQSLPALELLKDVDKYQKEAAESFSAAYFDVKPVQHLQEGAHVEISRPNPRGQRRGMGMEMARGSGPVHAGHDEAAANHMLAERRRRTKQKENFTTLRRLVPIISKADKASTLVDTITYLKLLQSKVQELQASKEAVDQQCEALENRCKGLREHNQALVDMISKDQPSAGSGSSSSTSTNTNTNTNTNANSSSSSSAIHLNLVHLKLQSMISIDKNAMNP